MTNFTEGHTEGGIREIFTDLIQRQLKQGTEIAGSTDWLTDTKKYRFDLALIVEVAELIEHTAWKWWRHVNVEDTPQIQLELVDILCFALSKDLQNTRRRVIESRLLVKDGGTKSLVKSYMDSLKLRHHNDDDVGRLLRLGVGGMVLDKETFFYVCEKYDLTLTKLHRLYVAKQALNIFRQDNGYKNGLYVKTWFGREDNTYLHGIVDNLIRGNVGIDRIEEEIYDELEEIYRRAVSTAL